MVTLSRQICFNLPYSVCDGAGEEGQEKTKGQHHMLLPSKSATVLK